MTHRTAAQALIVLATALSASGAALAQATTDLVPYSLLAAACLVTLGVVGIRHRPAG